MKCKPLWIMCIFICLQAAVWAADQSLTFTDMAQRQVTTPIAPHRIVCLGPGALRLVVYLQAEDNVVAVENMEKASPSGRPYWLAHPELKQLPSCGPGGPAAINKKPDLEKLLAVAPQVIFVTYMDAALADEVQQTLGIPVVVLSYGTFATFDETVFEALRIVGNVLNKEERANDVVAYFKVHKTELAARAKRPSGNTIPGVYVGGIGYRGFQGIDSTEQRYAPFEWVHVQSLAEGLPVVSGSHSFVDNEALLRLNPEIIFIDAGGLALVKEDYRKKPSYFNALKAFAAQKVYLLMPYNWYTTNIGTALADAYAVGRVLYPDGFADIDPEQKCDEIYTYLVGKPVYAQMKKDYGALGQPVPFIQH